MQALLQVDSSQSVPALVAAGRDSDPEVRQGIVAAVGEWGGPAAYLLAQRAFIKRIFARGASRSGLSAGNAQRS